jgi:hypothetical protein
MMHKCFCGCGRDAKSKGAKYALPICKQIARRRVRNGCVPQKAEIPRERRFLHCAHRCNGFCGHDAQLYRRQAERECFAVRVAQRVCPIGLSA